jgi:hypothetical protein
VRCCDAKPLIKSESPGVALFANLVLVLGKHLLWLAYGGWSWVGCFSRFVVMVLGFAFAFSECFSQVGCTKASFLRFWMLFTFKFYPGTLGIEESAVALAEHGRR